MESLDYCKQTKRVLIMIALMTLFIFELVIISGDEYSSAYDFQLQATKTMDQGVDLYQRGGFIDLHRANFSMRLYVDNTTMRELRAESKFINPDGSWHNYTELYFASDDYVSDTTGNIIICSLLDYEIRLSFGIRFFDFVNY